MGLCGSTPAAATVDLVGSTVGSSVGSTSAGSTKGERGTVSAGGPPQANAVAQHDPRQARANDANRGRSHSTEPSAAQRTATAAALRDIGDYADAAASADAAEAAADAAESLAGGEASEADNDLGRARMKIYRKMVETERQCYWDLKNLCDIFYIPARNRQLLGKNLISSIFGHQSIGIFFCDIAIKKQPSLIVTDEE